MIEGQVSRGKDVPAVLARMVVPGVDIGPRKRHVVDVALDLDVAQQADDRRQLEAEGWGPNFAFIRRNNLDLPLAPKRDSFLPVDDLEGFVRGVQKERLLHISLSHSAR